MKKIGEFIYEMDQLLGVKTAFVPAPQGGQGQQSPIEGGQAPGGQPPQGGDPSQGGQPPQGGGDPNAQLMQQVMQQVQALPPDVQQQIAPQLQQVQQLPPDQQGQALQQLAQGLQQMGGQGGGQPQGGDPSQQGGQPQDPSQQGGDPGSMSQQDGSANPNGHVKAENQLDNTQVTLTVRELMDITSGGKATQSLLKVKQMASQHNSKMQGEQQKQQMQAQQGQMDQQQQGGMGGGGIYAQAPDMSGKPPQGGGM